MLSKIRQSKKEKGFTIIEVLIVLAIAGLILLVVFLAVPALQRTSRNTQRNNDVAGILGAVNEFVNNNNGAMPTTATSDSDGKLTISGASGTNSTEANLGYYKDTGGGSPVSISATAPGSGANTTTINTVVIYKGAACNSGNTQAVSGATIPSRSIAATYTLENGSLQCKAS